MTLCSSAAATDEAYQLVPGADTAAYHECSSTLFTWAGPTVQRLTLGSGSTHEIHQRACFVAAGVYSLNMLRVSAGSTNDIVMVPQRSTSAAAPIVIHKAVT